MRPLLLAAVMAGSLFIGAAIAQPAPPPAGPSAQSNAPAKDASLSRSALKATTFKIGTTIENLGVLSVATGGLVGGGTLAVVNTAASWAVYTMNDFFWERYKPQSAQQTSDKSFDSATEAWWSTLKFITYKPVVMAIKFTSIYVYTESATTMLVYGTASSLANTAMFYVNNVGWDVYDWYVGTPVDPSTSHA